MVNSMRHAAFLVAAPAEGFYPAALEEEVIRVLVGNPL
jgi:hypothetical protein